MAMRFKPLLSVSAPLHQFNYYCPQPISYFSKKSQFRISAAKMATTSEPQTKTPSSQTKIIDSHLHVWASPQEVKPLSKHFGKYFSCFLEYLEWMKFCFFIFCFLRLQINILTFLAKSPLYQEMLISYLRYAFYSTYMCFSVSVFAAFILWYFDDKFFSFWAWAIFNFCHKESVLVWLSNFGFEGCAYSDNFEYENKSILSFPS